MQGGRRDGAAGGDPLPDLVSAFANCPAGFAGRKVLMPNYRRGSNVAAKQFAEKLINCHSEACFLPRNLFLFF